jgi:hypothetical protein
LHDVLLLDQFAHQLWERDWSEEVFGFLVLGGLLGRFGHGKKVALSIYDMLLLLTVSSYFRINKFSYRTQITPKEFVFSHCLSL